MREEKGKAPVAAACAAGRISLRAACAAGRPVRMRAARLQKGARLKKERVRLQKGRGCKMGVLGCKKEGRGRVFSCARCLGAPC